MSVKSFLSSLMAVSTRALSGLDSVTYVRLPAIFLAATATPRGNLHNVAAATFDLEPRRLVVLTAEDARLAIIAVYGWARICRCSVDS